MLVEAEITDAAGTELSASAEVLIQDATLE